MGIKAARRVLRPAMLRPITSVGAHATEWSFDHRAMNYRAGAGPTEKKSGWRLRATHSCLHNHAAILCRINLTLFRRQAIEHHPVRFNGGRVTVASIGSHDINLVRADTDCQRIGLVLQEEPLV